MIKKQLRSLLGSNWTPALSLGSQAGNLQIAPTVELWSPTGNWEIKMEFFCASTLALHDYNALLVFRKKLGSDGYSAVMSYTNAGDLMWHEDVMDKTAVDLSKDKAKIVLEGAITADKLHEVIVRYDHRARTLHIMVDGVADYHVMDMHFQDHDFDMVQVGRWVSSASNYLGSVSGQVTEIEMTDVNNGHNSRLYNLVMHNSTSTLPTTIPNAFVNHYHVADGRTYLKYQQTNSDPLPANFWEKLDEKLITVEGPDEIEEPGWYTYSLTHSFAEPQEIAWSTGGTHLDQFTPMEAKEGSRYIYNCRFYIPVEKYLDTRVHLNAQIKNFGTASKVIADSVDLTEAVPDPVAKMRCNLDVYPYAIPSGTRSEQATNKIVLDGYGESNFDLADASVVFHITSTDKPGQVTSIVQNTEAGKEILYSAVLSPEPWYGNFTTVVIEMETRHDYHMNDVPRVVKQYVFDKTALLDQDADKSIWAASQVWSEFDLWQETRFAGV